MNKAAAESRNQCQVVSASRRSDIPAFFTDWLMECIRAERAEFVNPFGGQTYRVSLTPESVHSLVFWSKDYRPLLAHLEELEERGYRLFFHFTITGLPRTLEPHVPASEAAVETLAYLSRRFSPKHIIWRFDPILFCAGLEEKHYVEEFSRLSGLLSGKVERCYFSFADFYAKVRRSLARREGMGSYDPPVERKRALAGKLAEIAAAQRMTLYSCCDAVLLQPGVQKGSCIDGELLQELSPEKPPVTAVRPTRPECGCYASRDIGAYNTCRHGCLYCYAGSPRNGSRK